MHLSLAADQVNGFPLVIATGTITEESLTNLGNFIRQTCETARVSGVIIDCEAIDGALTAEGLYRATPAFTTAVGLDIKVAYINPPHSWRPDDDQFSRDIAYNRGALLELFGSKDEAVRWLQEA